MNPTISIDGQHFVLRFEGHTVQIPINQPNKLVAVLMARRAGSLRIAEAGSPVQSMIDERAAIDRFCADRRSAALEELGI